MNSPLNTGSGVTDAELSAERIALVALIAERDGSEFDDEIHLSSEEGQRIVAALEAASRVSPFSVDELAQEIRRVDGDHSMGAGALSEALMPFFANRLPPIPADGRDAGLRTAAKAVNNEHVDCKGSGEWSDGYRAACENIAGAIESLIGAKP